MGGHGPATCGIWTPSQLVRLTGHAELAVPLGHEPEPWSPGLWCEEVCSLQSRGRGPEPGVHNVCVSSMRAYVHTVTASRPARHMGWLLGHVLRGWSRAVHRASGDQGTACDRHQALPSKSGVSRSYKKSYSSLSRRWSKPTVTLGVGRLEAACGPTSESHL